MPKEYELLACTWIFSLIMKSWFKNCQAQRSVAPSLSPNSSFFTSFTLELLSCQNTLQKKRTTKLIQTKDIFLSMGPKNIEDKFFTQYPYGLFEFCTCTNPWIFSLWLRTCCLWRSIQISSLRYSRRGRTSPNCPFTLVFQIKKNYCKWMKFALRSESDMTASSDQSCFTYLPWWKRQNKANVMLLLQAGDSICPVFQFNNPPNCNWLVAAMRWIRCNIN